MSENSGTVTVTNVQSETNVSDSSSTACTQNAGSGMSKALLIDEYSASDIPQPVSMILSTLENSTVADLTVVVLYVLTVECGFIALGAESEPGDSSCQFNVRRVRMLSCLPAGWKDNEGIYRLSFILQPFPNEICKLVCIPVNDKLIANMILTGSLNEAYSMVVDTTDFFGNISNSSPQLMKLKTLSKKYKDELPWRVRSSILNMKCVINGSILGLPIEILLKIIYMLDDRSFVRLISTCSYLYNTFENVDQVWHSLYVRKYGTEEVQRTSGTWKMEYQLREKEYRERQKKLGRWHSLTYEAF